MNSQETNGRKKILIIDDEPHVVTYMETLLQDNGYDTVSAPNGRVGMEMARSERPDLICLDISMPEQSGIRFYRDLKEEKELSAIPVLVVTAVTGIGGDPDPFNRFLSTRSQIPAPEGFFSKPIEKEKLLERLAELLT